jgi:hypothetical protein
LKPQAQPEASVLWPVSFPPVMTTVFTAPIARASSDRPCSSGMTACLHGNVMLSPL